jgi:hypothetical protein
MTLDRRQFVKVAASALIAGATTAACASDNTDPRALAHPDLVEMLGADRVRVLGARYRANMPSENSAVFLRAALSGAAPSRHLPWIHKSIADRVRDDFAAGRTVLVDGWVLSVTEARQCALASLSLS